MNKRVTTVYVIHIIILLLNFAVNVDEFLQEAETLSVQDMPRSASSLSVRTDASGAAVIITICHCTIYQILCSKIKKILRE